jgi:hypothetical protein
MCKNYCPKGNTRCYIHDHDFKSLQKYKSLYSFMFGLVVAWGMMYVAYQPEVLQVLGMENWSDQQTTFVSELTTNKAVCYLDLQSHLDYIYLTAQNYLNNTLSNWW